MDGITIVRSVRRRTVSIQIMPDASIKVTAPFLFPKWKINQYLKEQEAWIKKHQQIVRLRLQNKENKPDNELLFLGRSYPLQLRPDQKNIVEFSDKFYLGSSNKKYAEKYLTSWYKQQARQIISDRVARYAKIAGLHFNAIKITSAETRWGSCSSEKNLNFNWRLVMSPMPVIDYVVCHELAHLVELNHSRDFWETVRKMFPLYRQYRTWLKRNGDSLRI